VCSQLAHEHWLQLSPTYYNMHANGPYPTPQDLCADYLVIGAGAMGMAFVDTILSDTLEYSIIMVDRRSKPGGHWQDSYDFVRLHQPAAFYGVNSRSLGSGGEDLASGAEIKDYYGKVMDAFLSTKRVRYFPECEYHGNGKFSHLATGEQHKVIVRRKIVDATYLQNTVPATHEPSYKIAAGVFHIPINGLTSLCGEHAGYVVIGAGKTSMDAIIWLLGTGVSSEKITWIAPRDSWIISREAFVASCTPNTFSRHVKSDPGFAGSFIGSSVQFHRFCSRLSKGGCSRIWKLAFRSLRFLSNMLPSFNHLIHDVETLVFKHDVLLHEEATGVLARIDASVTPQMFRCATLSEDELVQLRRIKNVVRMGRVQMIDESHILLDKGIIQTSPQHVHIDCSASGICTRQPKPIFTTGAITLQLVLMCQQAFSAAFIAHVEAMYSDDKHKNHLCRVTMYPEISEDMVPCNNAIAAALHRWKREPELVKWLLSSRLFMYSEVTHKTLCSKL